MIDDRTRLAFCDKMHALTCEKNDHLRLAKNLQARVRRLRKKLRDLEDGIEQLSLPLAEVLGDDG